MRPEVLIYATLAAVTLVFPGWVTWRARDRARALTVVQQALDSSLGAVAIAGRSGLLEYVNPAFARLWGLETVEEAIGRDPVEFWAHPSDPMEVIDTLRRRGAWEGRMTALGKDGRQFPVAVSAQVVLDKKGRFAGMMASFLDVSEQIRATEELDRQRAFSDTLLQVAPVLVVLLADDGTVMQVNAAVEDVTGYAEADLQGRDWFTTMIPSRCRDSVQERFERAIAGDATRGHLNPILTRDGGEREIEWSDTTLSIPGSGGDVLLAVGVDVTERVRGERELARTRARLEEAQRMARIGSWELDVKANELVWSDEVYRIFDLDPEVFEPSYEGFLAQVHPEDRDTVKAAYAGSLESGEPYEALHRIKLADGRVEWVEERAQTLLDEAGRPVRSVGTVQLVTDRHLTSERLRRALNEREILLREVHHRVKNNLQLVSSLLYFHGRSYEDVPDVARSFAEVGQRLRSMILLHESLYRSQDMSHIAFLDYVRSLAGTVRSSIYDPDKAVEVLVTGEPVDLPVEVALPCGMIVTELVTNAFKHAFEDAPGGRIEVSVVTDDDGGLSLAVRDDGIGFPEGFSPERGEGFGWKLVRGLARQVDATLEMGPREVRVTVPRRVTR